MANSAWPLRVPSRVAGPHVWRDVSTGRLRWAYGGLHWWVQRIRVGGFSGAGATSQELDLHDYNANNLFPADVWLQEGSHIVLITDFSGGAVSACTFEFGDAGDPNGLLTASDVFTGATNDVPIFTTGAAQYALRYEAAFIPSGTLRTTTANVSALTAGELEIRIPYRKNLDVAA
jgi:hypothetical protein